MNKLIGAYSASVIVLIALFVPLPAFAATVGLSPQYVSVTTGETFNLVITVDPVSEVVYAAKIVMEYPADVVQATAFVYDNSWPLKQPGYDLMDNVNGRLIKTMGFPGGISAPTTVGMVTMKAVKPGRVPVNVVSSSVVLDANNNNVFTWGSTAVVTVTALTVSGAGTIDEIVAEPVRVAQSSPRPTIAPRPSIYATATPRSIATARISDPRQAPETEAESGRAVSIISIVVAIAIFSVAIKVRASKIS